MGDVTALGIVLIALPGSTRVYRGRFYFTVAVAFVGSSCLRSVGGSVCRLFGRSVDRFVFDAPVRHGRPAHASPRLSPLCSYSRCDRYMYDTCRPVRPCWWRFVTNTNAQMVLTFPIRLVRLGTRGGYDLAIRNQKCIAPNTQPPSPLLPPCLVFWTVEFRRGASRDGKSGVCRNGGGWRTRGGGHRARGPGSPPVCASFGLPFSADVGVVVVAVFIGTPPFLVYVEPLRSILQQESEFDDVCSGGKVIKFSVRNCTGV